MAYIIGSEQARTLAKAETGPRREADKVVRLPWSKQLALLRRAREGDVPARAKVEAARAVYPGWYRSLKGHPH
jgi:hypothetical protein